MYEAIVFAEDDEGSGPWSKHLVGDQATGRQGTGNREQRRGRQAGRQAG